MKNELKGDIKNVNDGVINVTDEMKEVKDDVKLNKDSINRVTNQVNDLDQWVKSIENQYNFNDKDVLEAAVAEEVLKQSVDIKADSFECCIRMGRFIISGVAETGDDKQLVKEIADSLDIEIEISDIVNTFRPKRNSTSGTLTYPPLLNVDLKNIKYKEIFISLQVRDKVSALNSDDRFHGIKLFPDQTFLQRKEFKELKKVAEKNAELASTGDTAHIYIVTKMMQVVKVKK